MSLPPRFSFIPASLIRRHDVPIHLRWTYVVLYALAWQHDYQFVPDDLEALAQTFSDLEGETITPRGMRERLQQLVNFHLVERRKIGPTWRTYLLLQHKTARRPSQWNTSSAATGDTFSPAHTQSCNGRPAAPSSDAGGVTCDASSDAGSVTCRPPARAGPRSSDAVQRHLPPPSDAGSVTCRDNNKHVVVDDVFHLDEQQQHAFYQLKTLGIFQDEALRLAQTYQPAHCLAWVRETRRQAKLGKLINPAGWCLTMIKSGQPGPARSSDKADPDLYIGGEYADFVEH